MKINLKRMSISSLHDELRSATVQTATGIRRMANAWVELRSRGEDLSRYNSPLTYFLPDVASGKLLAEMWLLYGGRGPSFLAQIATLVPEEQVKLATGDGHVQVLTDKRHPPRSELLVGLTLARLKQVIGGGVIRTPAQQEHHIVSSTSSIRQASSVTAAKSDDPKIEDFMSLGQWNTICVAADKAGVSPHQQIVNWLVRDKHIPARAPGRRTKDDGARAAQHL